MYTNTQTHTQTLSHVYINVHTQPAGSLSGEAYLTEGQAPRKHKLGLPRTTQAKAGTHKQAVLLNSFAHG